VEQKETRLVQSNITTHEVNAWQAMYTDLSYSYGILKKIIKKGAAPPIAGITNNFNITSGTYHGNIIINCNHSNTSYL